MTDREKRYGQLGRRRGTGHPPSRCAKQNGGSGATGGISGHCCFRGGSKRLGFAALVSLILPVLIAVMQEEGIPAIALSQRVLTQSSGWGDIVANDYIQPPRSPTKGSWVAAKLKGLKDTVKSIPKKLKERATHSHSGHPGSGELRSAPHEEHQRYPIPNAPPWPTPDSPPAYQPSTPPIPPPYTNEPPPPYELNLRYPWVSSLGGSSREHMAHIYPESRSNSDEQESVFFTPFNAHPGRPGVDRVTHNQRAATAPPSPSGARKTRPQSESTRSGLLERGQRQWSSGRSLPVYMMVSNV